MNEDLKPAALTLGDPAGIAGEITIKAWQQLKNSASRFFLVGDPSYIEQSANSLDLDCPIATISHPSQTGACFSEALPILPVELNVPARAGVGDSRNSAAITRSIEIAVECSKSGQAAGVTTNPINKAVLYEAGFQHPGHTEYLAELAGEDCTSVMMLACDALKVVPLTLHVSLKQAIEQIDRPLLIQVISIVHQEMKNKFGIENPRIAVSGLNPHAGEQGAMGREEIEIIQPVLNDLSNQGVDVIGPLPADTMFHAAARENYDVAVCMTHDQALIPIKTIAFDDGVNVTLGLPFVRTSPDHGTAFNIAGHGIAKPNSLIAAIKMAHQLHRGTQS